MLPKGQPDWFLRGVRIVNADLKTPEGKATLDSLLTPPTWWSRATAPASPSGWASAR